MAKMRYSVLKCGLYLLCWQSTTNALISPSSMTTRRRTSEASSSLSISSSTLRVGRMIDDFFKKREDDFVRLEEAEEGYGPGPALIFYNVPQGVQDEELVEMLRDGAPKAIKKGVSLSRMDDSTPHEWMDLSLEDALKKVVLHSKDPSFVNQPDPLTTDAGLLATTPVLFFSGFTNGEMMSTFQIISHEVHMETQGKLSVACAMAMPNAMNKPLRQVLGEISGDHLEIVKPRSTNA